MGGPLHSSTLNFMTEVFHRNLFLAGPAGQLEALLWTSPVANPPLVAVVCHPHPLFGGTMHNKVVFQAAKAVHLFGIPVLRFNFRGVGLSAGVHDKGRGEEEDVRAALDYLAAEFPGRPILAAGFSFGSVVGLRVGCEDVRVAELMGLGLPVNHSNFDLLRPCTKPKLIVQGGNDKFGSRENIESVFSTMSEPKRLVIVEGADHFFAGQLEKVGAAITEWLLERHPRPATASGPANS
jgi:alpha/beta superfamily hydrolase